MRILQVLTYYRPHISGLNIYVERLNKALARQGHEVTVLTSHYSRELAQEEWRDDVRIVRAPVLLRVSKGVIMPTFGILAWKWARWADVIHLHLPQFDAPGVALRGRLLGKPVVLTYHSDLQLPPGVFNRLAEGVVKAMNRLAGGLADAVVAYTRDFASHSPYLSRYLDEKLYVIPPPVELVEGSPAEVAHFRQQYNLNGKRVIGISARIATEKGLEVLLRALPRVLAAYPEARLLHASPEAVGEQGYAERLAPLFEQHRRHYTRLGTLRGSELTAFYRNLDCLVLCSLNNTETFGLVQVEAMINGVPVVASDLPGVRQPVTMTGMGEVTAVGDAEQLAEALIRVLGQPERYQRPAAAIAACFSPDQTAREYSGLYAALLAGRRPPVGDEPDAYLRLRALNHQPA